MSLKGMPENLPNYYERLGVPPSASQTDIERAFRRLAKQTHPDRNPDDPQANVRFRRVRQAHEVLSNPERRATYDARRRRLQTAPPGTLTATSIRETGCVTYYLPRVGVGLLAVLAFLILEAFGVWRTDDPEAVLWGIVGASVATGALAVVIFRLFPDRSEDYAVRLGPDEVCVWYENRPVARIPWGDVSDVHCARHEAVVDLRLSPDAGATVHPVPPVIPRVVSAAQGTRVRLDLTGTDVRAPALRQFLAARHDR
jgi:hypothetical protein